VRNSSSLNAVFFLDFVLFSKAAVIVIFIDFVPLYVRKFYRFRAFVVAIFAAFVQHIFTFDRKM